MTLAFSDFVSSKVSIYSSYYERNTTYLGKLTEINGDGEGFGNMIDMVGNQLTGTTIFVAQKKSVSKGGSVHIFQGSWNRWTNVSILLTRFYAIHLTVQQMQQLIPPPIYRDSSFGSSVSVDTSSAATVAVGCPHCNQTENAGQIYLYSTVEANYWSNTQVLTAAVFDFQKDPLKITYFLGDMTVVDDDVLLGRGLRFNGRTGVLGVVLFTKDSTVRQWSQQQVLQLDLDIEGFDIDGHTIVLSVPSQRGQPNIVGAGAVHVLYPNSKEFSMSGLSSSSHTLHTRGLQWSSRQTLFSSEPVSNGNFGSDISLCENQLIVGEQGTSTIHVFRRQAVGGQWSLSQRISPSVPMKFFSDNYLYGADLLLVGFPVTFGIPHLPSIEMYSQSSDWKCLVLTLEDQFGDGWDSAKLQIQTPDGSIDEFSSYCNYPNPLSFRYCPLHVEDGGLYTLSVAPGVTDSVFFWELQWRVFDENSGSTILGNFATRMEFFFDSELLVFIQRDVTGALQLPVSCSPCEKEGEVGGKAALAMSGSSWFSDQNLGTNYFVADMQGRKLIDSGSSCSATGDSCPVSLPDGSYVLRIGGDLNPLRKDSQWNFCGMSGDGSGAHIVFEITGSKCEVLAAYSKDKYCSESLQAQAVLEGELEVLLAVPTLVSTLNASDRAQVAYALSDQDVQLLLAKDIEVKHVASPAGSTHTAFMISFSIRISTDRANGVDPHDYAAVVEMVQGVAQQLERGIREGTVRDALLSNTRVPDSVFFLELNSVDLTNVTMQKRITLVETLTDGVEYEFADHEYQ